MLLTDRAPEQARLLIVGNPGTVHVGAHFLDAAKTLGLEVTLADTRRAYSGPWWLNQINWRMRGRRPTRLAAFGVEVLNACATLRPHWVVTTGIAPLNRKVLEQVGRMGIRRLNYLTDDPWNPAHRAPWFLEALPLYDRVFSPRRANRDDLLRHGCREVSYLPFAYAPKLHYPEESPPVNRESEPGADLLFAGGADADRVSYLAACIDAGFRVQLYGGYWQRYRQTRSHALGLADPQALRRGLGRAKAALCLVRRANRDGHVMRSFEIPATGACMLTEDTDEHRDLFGPDGKHVVYFRSAGDLVDRLRWLLVHESERARMAADAHRLIVGGKNTYRDRLETLLDLGQ
jgi:hypothetical protein